MGKISLVGLDLDGTLLNEEKVITAPTREALALAVSQGVQLVPVTGRPYDGIPAVVRELPFLEYVISCNGACIHDAKTGDILRERLIPTPLVMEVISILQGESLPFEVLMEGVGYAEAWVYEALIARSPQNSFLPKYIQETRKIVSDLLAFVGQSRGVEELFVMAGRQESVERVLAKLTPLAGLHVVHPGPGMLELTAAGVDKGEALLYLGKRLGVTAEQTMAIGDSGNDLAMLRAAGVSVAMGNATAEVKALADYVAKSNAEDGVAEALRTLVLA